jgi:sugar phosphate permease
MHRSTRQRTTVTSSASAELTTPQRYARLSVLILAAGAIYPLLYLRQTFEITILESFAISAAQLNQCYSILGVLFVVTYLPSGWLADRVAPRLLMSFALAFAGLLGVWFSMMPSFDALRLIFAGWGVATGLTFWGALIKATAMLGKPEEQGRFFGILDGGRGLLEAMLASMAIALFFYLTSTVGSSSAEALRVVIWMYVSLMLVLSPIVFFTVKSSQRQESKLAETPATSSLFADIKTIAAKQEVWLAAICILTGYQLFWATYSFSAFMQTHHGLTAVAVGSITTVKLWMRPIGAATAGFAGDFFNRERVLGGLMLFAAIALAGLVVLPTSAGKVALLGIVMAIGILTYAVRGIYWSTLESCQVSNRVKGLAIGIISLIGYSPDVYLPMINTAIREQFPGKLGYEIYFSGIAVFGLLGAFAAWRLGVIVARQPKADQQTSQN